MEYIAIFTGIDGEDLGASWGSVLHVTSQVGYIMRDSDADPKFKDCTIVIRPKVASDE